MTNTFLTSFQTNLIGSPTWTNPAIGTTQDLADIPDSDMYTTLYKPSVAAIRDIARDRNLSPNHPTYYHDSSVSPLQKHMSEACREITTSESASINWGKDHSKIHFKSMLRKTYQQNVLDHRFSIKLDQKCQNGGQSRTIHQLVFENSMFHSGAITVIKTGGPLMHHLRGARVNFKNNGAILRMVLSALHQTDVSEGFLFPSVETVQATRLLTFRPESFEARINLTPKYNTRIRRPTNQAKRFIVISKSPKKSKAKPASLELHIYFTAGAQEFGGKFLPIGEQLKKVLGP